MTEPRGIIAFDLDGTLIRDSTVCLHMASWTGHEDMPRLERAYAEGTMTNTEVAAADARFYKNKTRKEATAHFSSISLINGAPETLRWLRQQDLLPIIATITSRYAAEFLQERFGFEAASGCVLEEVDGVFTGEIAMPFDARDKAHFVAEFARDRGIDPACVVAVGDGHADLPMFEFAGLSIALNASDDAREVADAVVDGDDLRDIIPGIESYLPGNMGARASSPNAARVRRVTRRRLQGPRVHGGRQ
jgi:phosphoserine phosphatase